MESIRCLVVDDEPGMRLSVARALRDYTLRLPDLDEEVRFQVDQAETAEEGLEKIAQSPPDILLLDLKLPGMSGLEALERISESQPDLLVVMITAYASIETAVTATKRGAFDFLAKPFTPKELKDKLRKTTEHLTLSRRARQLAAEKRQVRFQFISVLAHELKAPLGAIEGYLNILSDRTLGNDLTAYDPLVGRSLTRIAGMWKMIADLTDLTRIESGQKTREFAQIDLREIAQAALDTVLPEASNRTITLNLHRDEALLVTADRSEMEIVLNNLITNAVKYNKDGGRVDVHLADSGDEVTLQVSDTGIGMTREEAEKLFKEFVRIKNSKTMNILGSGLGLSIVKKITAMYDGTVSVESKPDEGSTFTVRLKKHSEPASEGNES